MTALLIWLAQAAGGVAWTATVLLVLRGALGTPERPTHHAIARLRRSP